MGGSCFPFISATIPGIWKRICGERVLHLKSLCFAPARSRGTCVTRDSRLMKLWNAIRMPPRLSTRAGELTFLRTNLCRKRYPNEQEILHHNADLLRERAPSYWACLYDDCVRHHCAAAAHAGRGDVLSDRHGRAWAEDRAGGASRWQDPAAICR